ncbi:MAG: hypothetical protein QW035_01310 [Candidatus Anstonellales archaeon]
MISLIPFLLSLALSLLIYPSAIRALEERKFVGLDVHSKRYIPEAGGIVVVVCFLIFSLLSMVFFEVNETAYLSAVLTILFMSFIGLVDNLMSIRQWQKMLIPLIAALPLVVLKEGVTTMALPFIGAVDFGIFYTFLLIPVGVSVASNLSNMLAGYNGLETGVGLVILLALMLFCYINGYTEGVLIAGALAGAQLSLFIFNIYPARVFPGDVGTLTVGAAAASLSIIGNFEGFAAMLFIPHAVDFFIKAANKFPHSIMQDEVKDGIIVPKKVYGFTQLALKLKPMTERQLAYAFIAMEIIVALAAFAVYLKP